MAVANEVTPLNNIMKSAAKKNGFAPIGEISNSQPELSSYEAKGIPVADQGMSVVPNDGRSRGTNQIRGVQLDEGGNPTYRKFKGSNAISPSDNQQVRSGIPVFDQGGELPDELTGQRTYDKGREVDIHDGKHQLAIVKEGERVLNPAENERYKKMGLPKIYDDGSDVQPDEDQYRAAAAKQVGLAPIVTEPAPKAEDSQVQVRGSEPVRGTAPVYGTDAERKAIATDRQNAMGKGAAGIVDLGLAKIHENHLEEQPPALGEQPLARRTAPGYTPMVAEPTTAPVDMVQDKAFGRLRPITETAGEQRDFAQAEYKAKLADYDKQIQNALGKATAEGQEEADRLSLAKQVLQSKNPWGSEGNKPGFLGELGHIAAKVGNIAGGIVAPSTLALIPGTALNRAAREKGTLREIATDTQLATQRAAEEGKETPKPKLLGGEENVRTDAQGNRDRAWQMPDGKVQWVREGQSPAATAAAPAPAQATAAAPTATIGNQPNIAQVASEHPNTATYTYGKPVQPKEGEQPATDAQIADVGTRIKNNPYLNKDQRDQLQFPEGYKPTQNDVKERLANVKDIEDAGRQGKQDEFNNSLRKLQEENANLLAKARLAELEDKQKQADAKTVMNSNVAMGGLYAQEDYKDKMESWYKSGSFAKDSGLVTEIVNKEHGDKGAFSGAFGGGLVGSLLGPEGAAAGAGIGALTGIVAGPANGYLDTLKKQGISKEGYAAMQAYFNALPARMSYEIGVQGVSATALRSSQLIQKVLNTVPPPNTPQANFDSAFRGYYKPMETLTKGKINLTAPKDYTPPARTDFYPEEPTPLPKAGDVVNGYTFKGGDPNKKENWSK